MISWPVFKRHIDTSLETSLPPSNQLRNASMLGDEDSVSDWNYLSFDQSIFWFLSEPGDGWRLSLRDLRRIPRWLIAITACTSTNTVTEDHREYWRITAEFGIVWRVLLNRQLSDESNHNKIPGEPEEDTNFPQIIDGKTQLDRNIINDLCLLIRLVELKQFDTFSEKDIHPVLTELSRYSDRLGSTYGFSVLEGLLRRRCSHFNTDGKIKNSCKPEQRDFLKGIMRPNDRIYLTEGFRLVESIYATDDTRKTLVEIDRLPTIEMDKSTNFDDTSFFIREMNDLVDNHEINHPDGPLIGHHNEGLFLDELRILRNSELHREDLAQSSSAIIVTLCCLLFWDSLTEYQFRILRKLIPESLQFHREIPGSTGPLLSKSHLFEPGSFYKYISTFY